MNARGGASFACGKRSTGTYFPGLYSQDVSAGLIRRLCSRYAAGTSSRARRIDAAADIGLH
jgi:hypothetical protein